MASFDQPYQIIRANEGGYANHTNDVGGETYAGIARNIWPNWSGWGVIDRRKLIFVYEPLKTNDILPELEDKVREFYLARWNESRAAEINSQAVANIYFDFYILHSKAVQAMQEVLNASFNAGVTVDNGIGPQTLAAINSVDPDKLHDVYKAKRIQIHTDQAERYPSQLVFLQGWLKRANMFPTLTEQGQMVVGGLVIAALIVIYLTTQNKRKNETK